MSNLSKVVLVAAGGFAVSIILIVHMSQNADRKRMRDGVRKDLERQKKKKNNQDEIKQQKELTKMLEEQRTKT